MLECLGKNLAPLANSVTLGQLFNSPELCFSHLESGDYNSMYPTQLVKTEREERNK